MNPKRFLYGLLFTVGLQIFVNLILLQLIPSLSAHTGFIAVSVIVMMLFCLFIYGAARIVVQSSKANLFIQLVMIAVFLKLILCLGLIVVYKKGFDPNDHSFIWSFLFIYITSTIYEVIFLEKVGRQKNPPSA